jgi:hypothetical protein
MDAPALAPPEGADKLPLKPMSGACWVGRDRDESFAELGRHFLD